MHFGRNALSYIYHKGVWPLLSSALDRSRLGLRYSEVVETAEFVHQFGDSTTYSLADPQGVGTAPKEIRDLGGEIKTVPSAVCELSDVEVVGTRGIAIAPHHRYILEEAEDSAAITASVILKAVYQNHEIPVRYGTLSPTHDRPMALLLGTETYYHWMAEFLPRVRGVEAYAETTGTFPDILVRDSAPDWMRESVTYLGVPEERIYKWDGGHLRAERFILPTLPRHQREYGGQWMEHLSSPDALTWVSTRITQELDVDHGNSERILITRRNADSRRMVNESAVRETLQPFGFEPYTLDEMEFEDQVRLFARAETVVAPHGAGLVNIMFGENLDVVELAKALA